MPTPSGFLPLLLALAGLAGLATAPGAVAAPAAVQEQWSFQPVTRPAPAPIRHTAWPRNEVDRFVLSRLEREHLQPAREADRVTWLRRVTFDLTGLPPAPERVTAFLRDPRPDAYERVVDELLRSPRYGERWAQHWLDVVRYVDTHG